MRLVHEIFNKAQVGIGASPYLKKIKDKYSADWKAEVTITAKGLFEGDPDEVIIIEGSARYLIPLFRDVLQQLELLEEDYIKDGIIKKRKL